LPLAGSSYDLIFMYCVCQYLDRSALLLTLGEVLRLLANNGVCVLGNVPDRHRRLAFVAGLLGGHRLSARRALGALFSPANRTRDADDIGEWYSRGEIRRIATEVGFRCDTVSSKLYRYRFHARLIRA
jgi:hypothetical protein